MAGCEAEGGAELGDGCGQAIRAEAGQRVLVVLRQERGELFGVGTAVGDGVFAGSDFSVDALEVFGLAFFVQQDCGLQHAIVGARLDRVGVEKHLDEFT